MLECWCSASHWHCPLHARYSRVNTTWHVVLNAFASSPVKDGSVGWRLWIWTSSWNGHWHGVWLATYTVMADYSDYLLAFWRTLNNYVFGTHHVVYQCKYLFRAYRRHSCVWYEILL